MRDNSQPEHFDIQRLKSTHHWGLSHDELFM